MQYIICKQIFPDWELDALFFTTSVHPAFKADASMHTHPIDFKIDKETDGLKLFDDITYDKSASIIRMINILVDSYSENTFLLNLGKYIKANIYGGVTTELLFESLDSAVNESISMIM